ncbi:MAG: SpoIID/LytB domain-containing protein [Elusimicrobia bacterium]|nr:SpoIID/LytB domain-containing protein [Elusimicrobiota bacterium]
MRAQILAAVLTLVPARAGAAPHAVMDEARELYSRGYISRAAELYEKAAENFPESAEPSLNAAVLYRQLGEFKPAERMLQAALKIEPESAEVRAELGWAYYQQGLWPQARAEFETLLKETPDYPPALLGAAAASMRLSRSQESLSHFKRLQEVYPRFSAIDRLLGEAHFTARNYRLAARDFINALGADFTAVETRLPLATAYEELGLYDLAWEQLTRFLRAGPWNSKARSAAAALAKKLAMRPRRLIAPPEPPASGPFEAVAPGNRVPSVRIGLMTGAWGHPRRHTAVALSSSGAFNVIGSKTGKVYARVPGGEKWTARRKGAATFEIAGPKGLRFGPFRFALRLAPEEPALSAFLLEIFDHAGDSASAVSRGEYRGIIEIKPASGDGLEIANVVDVEQYLLGVVPAEMPHTWPPEALKAQAVIARSEALYLRQYARMHRGLGYHLCDGPHCQVYRGVRAETPETFFAVEQTRGEVLRYANRSIHTLYHANCGGYTQDSGGLSGWSRAPYLKGRLDGDAAVSSPPDSPWRLHQWLQSRPQTHCNQAEFGSPAAFRWLRIVPFQALQEKLDKQLRIGRLRAILPLARSPSGHVNEILIRGSRRSEIIRKEQQIRGLIGLGSIRSTLFEIEAHRNPGGQISEFWIYGGGWGHGVGLCQTGAAGMAKAGGRNYLEILNFYYHGAEIQKWDY